MRRADYWAVFLDGHRMSTCYSKEHAEKAAKAHVADFLAETMAIGWDWEDRHQPTEHYVGHVTVREPPRVEIRPLGWPGVPNP